MLPSDVSFDVDVKWLANSALASTGKTVPDTSLTAMAYEQLEACSRGANQELSRWLSAIFSAMQSGEVPADISIRQAFTHGILLGVHWADRMKQ